jgi:hypothetical protein
VDRTLAPRIEEIRARATALAAALGPTAHASTTVGVERATLRLLGVQGLDRAGAPLAASVVERAIGDDPVRLSRGILLPFVAALVLYDTPPPEIALDVADGTIDLDLEAEALADPDRRARIEAEAASLVEAALARVEANRTARRELLDVLGGVTDPLVGTTLRARRIDGSGDEAAALVGGGADLLHVDVPSSRELAERLEARAGDGPGRDPAADPRIGRGPDEVAPTGSQRALADIRSIVDEAAAGRRAYVRLETAALPLGAPELSVVAGFERIDVVDADPIDEIVGGGVDPSRALADHAFVRRLALRSGSLVHVTDGPLVVGPDLASGTPSPADVRAGRAIALQALSVALARRSGLGDDDMLLGSLPAWILDERDAAATTIGFLVLQHGLHPGLPIAVREPAAGPARSRWAAMRSIAPLVGVRASLELRDADALSIAAAASDSRTVAETGAVLSRLMDALTASSPAWLVAERIADAAVAMLDDLERRGWDAVAGPMALAGSRGGFLAAQTCVRRSDAPEILAGDDPS